VRERLFVFLTVRSRLPQSLLGQEVVITLGDASTRQGTVCDVDRRGTVALRKVRPSGAGAPTRAPLVRGEHRAKTFGVPEPNRKTTIRRRRCGGSPRIFSRTKRFLARSVFSVEAEETHHILVPFTTAATAADQGIGRFRCALAHTPVIARSTARLQPPDRPRSADASLSEPRRRGSFREQFFCSLSRSVDHVDPSTKQTHPKTR
jgi:hypothetical protein